MEEPLALWIARHTVYWLFMGNLYAGAAGILFGMYQQYVIRRLEKKGESAYESLIAVIYGEPQPKAKT